MKNLVLLTQTLTLSNRKFKSFADWISSLDPNEYTVCKFYNFESTAEDCGVKDRYSTLMSIIRKKGVSVKNLAEHNIDEYFLNHAGDRNNTVYVTPTDSVSIVITSAALLHYTGKVYIIEAGSNDATNITPLIDIFNHKSTIGIKGLNKNIVSYNKKPGTECHYTINGTTYSEPIRSKAGTQAGAQGYTFLCNEAPGYRIKIWDGYADIYHYEIEELEEMIKKNLEHPYIAFPVAIVYNRNDEPIGFVMNNFEDGSELDIFNLRKRKNPLAIIEKILTAMLWMEAHDLYHRDLNHNILINKYGELCIIDIDSIQYKAFPAKASAGDALNALPCKYANENLFYNSIDISYTTMAFLVAALFDISDFFGTWDENGMCTLNNELLTELKNTYPSIYQLVKKAYIDGKPVAIEEQLEVVRAVINGNTAATDDFILDNDVDDDIPLSDIINEIEDNGDYGDHGDHPINRMETPASGTNSENRSNSNRYSGTSDSHRYSSASDSHSYGKTVNKNVLKFKGGKKKTR